MPTDPELGLPPQKEDVVSHKPMDHRKLEQVYIVARSTHYGHEMNFEKFSNCGWRNTLHFSNGGISVNLLRYDMERKSKVKRVISAYKDLDRLAANADAETRKTEKPELLN